jgi:carbamoyl-phosphate synthase/aspartate carbamoyltransferase
MAAMAMALELEDGYFCQGTSFGADKSVAGELVFQTGMVGYPESITDPSYRGQILVVTFPLVGNYGVPDRQKLDDLLKLPAYFESSQIHIAGLVVASYCGEEYSHHIASSSLGQWLKDEGVPAIYGVDTRLLTKRIRDEGSMLGRLLTPNSTSNAVNGTTAIVQQSNGHSVQHEPLALSQFNVIDWVNPNVKNLVAEGILLLSGQQPMQKNNN